MKTLLGNIAVTETQKELIMRDSYLQDPKLAFSFTFESPVAEIDPFIHIETVGEKYFVMSAELDVNGWITVGEILAENKVAI